jgi:hypothetical protein
MGLYMKLDSRLRIYLNGIGIPDDYLGKMKVSSPGTGEICKLLGLGAPSSFCYGVVIPALDINGEPTDNFSLLRIDHIDNEHWLVYKKNHPSHTYFPPDVDELTKSTNLLVVTTGVIDACMAVLSGIPCVAIQDTYKWNNSYNLYQKRDGSKSEKELKRNAYMSSSTAIDPLLLNRLNTLRPKDVAILGSSNLQDKEQEKKGLEILAKAIKTQVNYSVNAVVTYAPNLDETKDTTINTWLMHSGASEVVKQLMK